MFNLACQVEVAWKTAKNWMYYIFWVLVKVLLYHLMITEHFKNYLNSSCLGSDYWFDLATDCTFWLRTKLLSSDYATWLGPGSRFLTTEQSLTWILVLDNRLLIPNPTHSSRLLTPTWLTPDSYLTQSWLLPDLLLTRLGWFTAFLPNETPLAWLLPDSDLALSLLPLPDSWRIFDSHIFSDYLI